PDRYQPQNRRSARNLRLLRSRPSGKNRRSARNHSARRGPSPPSRRQIRRSIKSRLPKKSLSIETLDLRRRDRSTKTLRNEALSARKNHPSTEIKRAKNHRSIENQTESQLAQEHHR